MWIRFLDDFDYRGAGFTIAYKAGMTMNVTTAAADAAVAKGKAVRMSKVGRDAEPTHVHVDTKESRVDGWTRTDRVGDPVFLVEVPDGG